MKVVHLNTNDIKGGAARAAYRLHQGLREGRCDSRMYVRCKQSGDDSVQALQPQRDIVSRLYRRLRRVRIGRDFAAYADRRPADLERFSDDRTQYARDVAADLPRADVYNLHWISSFIDLSTFLRGTRAPIVWTLHDMNAFTGGCHYNVGCERYQEQCGRCPQLGSAHDDDLSRAVWQRKSEAYDEAIQQGRLHIVCPSRWLANEARQSSLLGAAPIQVIPYGLDTSCFRPRSSEGLRTGLGIPEDNSVVLFVADSTTNTRKGFRLLAEALEGLPNLKDISLVSIGSNEPTFQEAGQHLHLGKLTSDDLLAVLYSMADVFVIPSQQDNLPNTVLEAMACGTPVVGFDTGGIPDMVRPGETGWLAETGNVRSLRDAIERAFSEDGTREPMSRRCRAVVEDEYTLAIQAERYRALYEGLIGSKQKTTRENKSVHDETLPTS